MLFTDEITEDGDDVGKEEGGGGGGGGGEGRKRMGEVFHFLSSYSFCYPVQGI
uniref:Uncharacterized protein n=1 Tax=Tetranychus urticae TaxID=32264 RepID=T1K625_TETUR